MIVVSDTSPIRALANLGLLPILGSLHGEVVLPSAVESELADPRGRHAPVELVAFDFIRVREVVDVARVAELREDLDPGESEALVLAMELGADLVLIDESTGRTKARQMGLDFVGVVGVLLEAKQEGRIRAVRPLLDRLRDEFRFFLAPRFYEESLRLAGESREGTS